jgi:hypothetical protein
MNRMKALVVRSAAHALLFDQALVQEPRDFSLGRRKRLMGVRKAVFDKRDRDRNPRSGLEFVHVHGKRLGGGLCKP